MWSARAIDQNGQRETDGDAEAGQHAQRQHADEGGQRRCGVDGPHAGKALQRLDVDQAPHGAHHDGSQDGLGEIVRDTGDREHHDEHDGGADQAGQLRSGAARVAQGRARQTPADHDAAKGPGADVGQTEGDQLLVGVDLIAVADGEGPGAAQGLGVDHHGDAGGARQQAKYVGGADVGQPRRRQAARDGADHGDPMSAQVEGGGGGDAEHEDRQRPRDSRPAPHAEQQDERDGAHEGGHEARLV